MRIRFLFVMLTLLLGNLFVIAPGQATETTWTKIYELTNPIRKQLGYEYSPGYGLNQGDSAATYKLSGSNFDRIRYRMEITISNNLFYADISFDKWANSDGTSTTNTQPTIDNLQIPTGSGGTGNFAIQTNVTNLDVQSNFTGIAELASAISTGSGFEGRLEIWPSCYGPGISGLSPQGAGDTFDFDDGGFGPDSSCYGSFQIHNLTKKQTIIAHNRGGVEVGLGNYLGGNPDWTFSANNYNSSLLYRDLTSSELNSWKLQIYVGNSSNSVYQINFDPNGGISNISANFALNSDALQTLPTQPTRENYSFLGWSTDGITPISQYIVTGPATLYAVWKLNPPTILSAILSGTTRVGETLFASAANTTGVISNTSYRWQRAERGNPRFSDIVGATSSTYLLLPRDSEKYIRVLVTVNNNSGSATATSLASTKIEVPSRFGNKDTKKP